MYFFKAVKVIGRKKNLKKTYGYITRGLQMHAYCKLNPYILIISPKLTYLQRKCHT